MPQGVRLRPPDFAHTLILYPSTAPGDVPGRIAGCDVVITNKVRIGPAALNAAPGLRLIAVAATGTDGIDLAACRDRGVVVCNVRDYALDTVPEHAIALLLALRRNLLGYRQSVAALRWQQAAQFCYFDYPISDLRGAVFGVIGHGALGRRTAELARAFGMEVVVAGRKGERAAGPPVAFEEVLERSDVLSLHCPLTPQTRGLIGKPEFDRMRRAPILINTARGGLVDEAALAEALRDGRISAAGFDVVSEEPPPHDHPFMSLLELPNFILTPHVAWASQQAMQALADQLIGSMEAFWRGEPRYEVGAPLGSKGDRP